MGKIVIKRGAVNHLNLVERGARTIFSATQFKALMTEDSVTLTVHSNTPLDIKVNDWFEVYGDVYRINQSPEVSKLNEARYEYTIRGEGAMYDLMRVKFLSLDDKLEFPLIGTISTFLSLIEHNMQRFSTLWTVEPTVAGETKTITFNGDSCLSALQKICQEFDTEFWVKNNTVYTGSFGNTTPLNLQYGKGKGLYDLQRKVVNADGIINRLYVEGGTQNIPSDYRGFSDKLKFSAEGYIEDTVLISDIGLREGYIQFPDIYPSREGQVSIKAGTTVFTDSTLDFDINAQLIPGTTAKVHFNTGSLAGYSFEIKSYVHATKTLEIIPFDNENGQIFPDSTFQFEVGDKYVLLDIIMPTAYIEAAEAELLIKGTEQFNLKKQSQVSYDLNLAEDFVRELPTPIGIGDLVHVLDPALGIDKVIRVNQVTRNFIEGGEINDYNYKIVIADTYEIALSSKIQLEIQKVKNVINVNKIDQLRLSRIGLQVTEELKDSIYDPDGYFDPVHIKPESIEAYMLSVGTRSQAISTNLIFRTNVGLNPNAVAASASVLYSQTLEKQWNISALAYTVPDNALRYVFAKVSKTGTTGTLLVSASQMQYDSDPSFYHINLGMLSSVVEGVRIFVPTYGQTTITGGLVRTGIISDELGSFQINLNTGVITADQITFKAPDNSYKDLTTTIGDIDTSIENLNDTRDYVNTTLQTDLADLKNRADGVIESWFYSHTPTLANLPASLWTTDAIKDSHIGDTFTNIQEFVDNATTPDAGKAWRFLKNETTGAYAWNLIANSDSTKALIEAGKAKDTADSKRRVFIVQPFPPYDLGDLWSQGPTGEFMKCKFARLSGLYVATDWEKASKYTDDTRAIQAEANAKDYTDTLGTQLSGEISDLNTQLGTLQTEVSELPIGALTDTALFGIKQQKNIVEGEYQDVYNRYVIIRDDAFLTDKTALNNAYTEFYNAYLSLTSYFDTAFNDRDITQAEKDELNNRFSVYKQQTALFSAQLQTAVKTIEQNKINNIQIGGRNLVLNSPNFLMDGSDQGNTNASVLEGDYVKITFINDGNVYSNGVIKTSLPRVQGETYTLSFEVNSEIAVHVYFYVNGTRIFSNMSPATSGQWVKVSSTYTQTEPTIAGSNSILFGFLGGVAGKVIKYRNLKLEKGNKATDWTPAPEDVQAEITTSKAAAELAAKNYSDAQDALKETTTKAYADTKISEAEQRSITDATNKAEAAKTYAVAQDNLLNTQLIAYTDGKISTEEAARIQSAQDAVSAAKAYADAQDVVAKTAANAYADGIVDAEEARAIADAEAKMNAAKAHADTAIANVQIGGRNYFTNSEIKSLTGYGAYASTLSLVDNSIRVVGNASYVGLFKYYVTLLDAQGEITVSFLAKNNKANVVSIGGFPNGNGTVVFGTLPANSGWVQMSKTFIPKDYQTDQVNAAYLHIFSIGDTDFQIKKLKVEYGNKHTDWTPAPEDIEDSIIQAKADSIASAKSYSDAQDALKETSTKAYADGIVTAAEQRSITDATNKAEAAKTYALAQDAVLKTQVEAYADGKISVEENARIQQAQSNLQAAKDYAEAQADLAEVAAKAYADGEISAEEQRAIADATAKMEAAKTHAQGLVNNIQIGGRNLLRDTAFTHQGNGAWYLLPERFVDGDFIYVTQGYGWGIAYVIPKLVPGTYIFSVWVKSHVQGVSGKVRFSASHSLENNSMGWTTDEWVRMSHQFTIATELTNVTFYLLAESGSGAIRFSKPKLEKGNKATDWTPAPEDVESAYTALINAEIQDVENKITSLQNLSDTVFSDGLVEVAEAKAIEKYINLLDSEKTDLQAKYVAIESDVNLINKQPLQSAWGAYDTSHTLLKGSITTAISGGKTNPTEKADVDTKFADYKAKLNSLSTALENATKSIEQKRIDNVKIGGRNYARNGNYKNTEYINVIVNITSLTASNNNLRVIGGNSGYYYHTGFPGIPLNETITISFWVKNNLGGTVNTIIPTLNGNNGFGPIVLNGGQDWTKYEKTGRISDVTASPLTSILFENYNSGSFDISIKELKVEIGNKATDWTPAPEDIEAKIDNIQIGGRNLVLGSPNFLINESDHGNLNCSVFEGDYVKITPINSGNAYNTQIKTSIERVQGETYTLSFEYQTDMSGVAVYWYASDAAVFGNIIHNTNGGWARCTQTYVQSGATVAGSVPILFGFTGLTASKTIKYRNLKLEKGNKATDWTPAPEDVQAAYKAYSDAAAYLAETNSKAWADGEIDAAEARAITDATTKMNQAKAHADSLASGLQTQINTATSNLSTLNSKTNWISPTTIPGLNAFAAGTFAVGDPVHGVTSVFTGEGGPTDIFLAAGFTDVTQLQNGTVWFKRNGHFRLRTASGLSFDSETGTIVNRYLDTPGNPISLFIGTNNVGNPEITFYDRAGLVTYKQDPNGIMWPNSTPETWTATPMRSLGNTVALPLDTSKRNTLKTAIQNTMCYNSMMNSYGLSSNVTAYQYNAGQSAYSEGYRQYEGYKTANNSRTSNIPDGWYVFSTPFMMTDPGTEAPQTELMYISGGKVTYSELMVLTKYPTYNYPSC